LRRHGGHLAFERRGVLAPGPVALPGHRVGEALRLPDDPEQLLVTYSAPPSSEAAAALRLLASWHADPPPDSTERHNQTKQS